MILKVKIDPIINEEKEKDTHFYVFFTSCHQVHYLTSCNTYANCQFVGFGHILKFFGEMNSILLDLESKINL